MNVVLYGVGRNLNRAHRVCASFGVKQIGLVDCGGVLEGRPYSPPVPMVDLDEWSPWGEALVLDVSCRNPTIYGVDWSRVGWILVGGETRGVPAREFTAGSQRVWIPTYFELTVESALSVALYEWRRATRTPCPIDRTRGSLSR